MLDYDMDTGVFVWKETLSNIAVKGSVAGCKIRNGREMIGINGRKYYSHRLAWFYVHGDWPDKIDHINRIVDDNRLCNLRNVDHSGNMKNQKLHHSNVSGISGVNWHTRDQKWYVQISSEGIRKYLGSFGDFFEACCARKSAEVKYGFHPNHGRNI